MKAKVTLENTQTLGVEVMRKCSVEEVIKETPDTYTLMLKPLDKKEYNFVPGQFNMLYAFGVGEVPISLSGDPDEKRLIAHTVRIVGAVTNALVNTRKPGFIGLRGPFGNGWPLEKAKGKDVIIVAGGIGLAPLRPAIYYVLKHRKEYGKFFFLYGARTPNDLLYKKELKEWKSRFDMDTFITVDAGDEKWTGNVGVVTTLFKRIRLDPDNTYAFVCGPEIMMKFTVLELRNQGLTDDKIYISMERNMKCGMGLCGHCQFGPYFVCKDGPVFSMDQINRFFGRREV
ncbi:MAG: FAD/NAD(P)-binding protein [Nitrososphaerota archaeon]